MGNKLKSYFLVLCLFVFLFVIIGGGLHLNPIGAFTAALSATPLILHSVNRWGANRAQAFPVNSVQKASRSTTYAFDRFTVCDNCGQVYDEHNDGDEACPIVQTNNGKASTFRAVV
jgi:hypothetical protein